MKSTQTASLVFMGRYYDENYELLKQKLSHMAALVQQMIDKAIDAVTTDDALTASQIVETDGEIDRIEVEIDELVMKLLALQQPMAVDLRFLITALKINNDLERMGDQAVNIAQAVLHLSREAEHAHLVDFTRMEEVVLEMVGGCIAAFFRGDVELARQVCARDDEVDAMNSSTISRLASHLLHHPEDANCCFSLLLITRNFERIADLSTNIAEDVVYYIEGKIIKHLH